MTRVGIIGLSHDHIWDVLPDLVVNEDIELVATASAQLKPARLETGLVVQVPPFIANGDTVRVNTETGEYQSRA